MSIQEYSGRTVDVLAYKGGRSTGVNRLTMELALPDDSGEITAGVQKLAQRFLIELLTEKGSLTYLPLRGCDFMREARLGLWQTPLDIMSSFSSSLLDIKDNLTLEETGIEPSDERFLNAELLTVTLSDGEAAITVRVTSRAGTTRTFISPLKVTLR